MLPVDDGDSRPRGVQASCVSSPVVHDKPADESFLCHDFRRQVQVHRTTDVLCMIVRVCAFVYCLRSSTQPIRSLVQIAS